ncbi:MAG: hypothetical protein GWM98_04825 [Nitrospinaceae bacterium]|nr:hypothetical protein [Deltaproteobacteria bacterium]NIY14244.1 hypothetical protein [Nitrospinaceae bacterium]
MKLRKNTVTISLPLVSFPKEWKEIIKNFPEAEAWALVEWHQTGPPPLIQNPGELTIKMNGQTLLFRQVVLVK